MNETDVRELMAREVEWTATVPVDPGADIRRGRSRLRRSRLTAGAGVVAAVAAAAVAVPVVVGANGPATVSSGTESATQGLTTQPSVIPDDQWRQLEPGVWFKSTKTSDGGSIYRFGTKVSTGTDGTVYFSAQVKGPGDWQPPLVLKNGAGPVTVTTLLRGDIRTAKYAVADGTGLTLFPAARVYRLESMPGWVLVKASFRASVPAVAKVRILQYDVGLSAYDARGQRIWHCVPATRTAQQSLPARCS